VIRYIFEAEPRHQRMSLLAGLEVIILIFWKELEKLLKHEFGYFCATIE
jgi:hypothetical protein